MTTEAMEKAGTLAVTVRVAEYTDLDFFVEMALELRNVETSAGKTGYVADFKEFVKYIIVFFDGVVQNDRFVMLVAEQNGEPVGMALGEIQGQELFFDPPIQGNILMLVIKEEARRSRVGIRMVGAMEAIMYEAGVRKMVCDCYQANEPPQWGLVRCGYHYEHVRLARDMDGSRMEDRIPQEDILEE